MRARERSALQVAEHAWDHPDSVEAGLRLRYEFRKEFAPYVGVSWLRSFGQTAALRRGEGEDRSIFQLVAGIRMWF